MMKEAETMNVNSVVCQFLWNPNSWYVLEQEGYLRVLFAGHLLTLPATMATRYMHSDNVGFWEKSLLSKCDFKCPMSGHKDNRM